MTKPTCLDCIHQKPCFEFGNVLDPLHGGVICDDFKHKDDVMEVVYGEWETVVGVLTPGGDPLLRCPYCKSKESEHLCGVEHPRYWVYCPICGAQLREKGVAE